MADEVMITTTDNPFNPLLDYDSWMRWDMMKGYNTNALLARITITSHELSDEDQSVALRRAMDEIVKYNASGVHTLVTREVFDKR